MNQIIKFLLTAFIVLLLGRFLSGIHVDDYITAILVALVLAVLNVLVKPIFTILTLPITIITFGLFLLVINGIIILLAGYLVGGFHVDSIWSGILFSILLTILQSIIYSIVGEDKK
ncbi:phage holin family protein [Formosa sediminum]|uniref:Phage holin family protein n=1 Tax=Formosa sediminum TaxID=2594004 RepID=A0A516GN03_9FLAO|nr:phage holin family protein [Formosa sediminum]QDO92911.1 phage holin family protein [Formosa sediminum]